MTSCSDSDVRHEPPWYGTVRPVVWEDGGGNPASYPMPRANLTSGQAPTLLVGESPDGDLDGFAGDGLGEERPTRADQIRARLIASGARDNLVLMNNSIMMLYVSIQGSDE